MSAFGASKAAAAFITPGVAASGVGGLGGRREPPPVALFSGSGSSYGGVPSSLGVPRNGSGGMATRAAAAVATSVPPPPAHDSETRSSTELELELVFPDGPSLDDLRLALVAGRERPMLSPGRAAAQGKRKGKKGWHTHGVADV